MTAWYYSDSQRNRLGPVAAADLAALHEGGQLESGTLVWREGLSGWTPWREVMAEVLGRATPAAVAPPVATPSIAPASTGAATDGRARFAPINDEPALATATGYNPYQIVDRAPVSPYAAPQADLAGHALAIHAGEIVYAGFWKRYAAYWIDALIVGVAGFIIQMMVAAVVFGGIAALQSDPGDALGTAGGIVGLLVMYLAPLFLAAAYFGFFHASANQATLGKMAVGIKVTAEDGGPISFWRGFGRYFGLLLSSLPLGIGLVMAGFTDRKRALHDMVCSTLVVDRWAFTAQPERQRTDLGVVTIVIMVLSLLGLVAYIGLIGVFIAAMGAGMASH